MRQTSRDYLNLERGIRVNWINELYDLYEKNKNIAGEVHPLVKKYEKKEEITSLILLPVYHTTVAAQITVTIDKDGNYLRADEVSNNDKLTIIPITDKSSSRTTAPAPNPYCDNLKYLAGDYMKYYRQATGKKPKDFSVNHEMYIDALEQWKNSKFNHPKVEALYKYLKKKILIKDLVDSKLIKLDEEGRFKEKEKIQTIEAQDSFVRFRILGDGLTKECWLDQTLQNSFINYYNTILESETKDLCFLTGEVAPTTYLQPKKIRHEGDGSKLISSNDDTNYTYKGRFLTKDQAFSVGFEAAQKVQNALKWIIRKQATSIDELYIVTWESDLQPIPEWNQDTDTLIDAETSMPENDWMDEDIDEKKERQTGEIAAAKFNAAIKGYSNNFDQTSHIVLLAVDAATTGRLALVENQVFEASDYLANIKHWHESCFWEQVKFKDNKLYRYYGMAGVQDIIVSIYGNEQNGIMTLNNKKLNASLCRRLLPSIINKKKIPIDIVRMAVNKASSPVSFDKRYNWEKTLCITCSLVKNEYNRRNNKEEWTLEVNENTRDRNYLFGRLLAIADKAEYSTYSENDSKRVTNAMRYMETFSRHPFTTWKMIYERIQPYLNKKNRATRNYYEGMIDGVMNLFIEGDYESNVKLNGLYLLGFSNQKSEMKKKKNNETNEENEGGR